MPEQILTIQNLNIHHIKEDRSQALVKDVCLSVEAGIPLSLVGETGCGKSLVAQAVLGLLPPELPAAGRVLYRGSGLQEVDSQALRRFWGRSLFLFPQEPALALNPTMRARNHVKEIFDWVGFSNGDRFLVNTASLMRAVGLSSEGDGWKFPFQLSGGMRQRLAAAVTLAQPADLIIADEPTKGLDMARRDLVVDLLKGILKRDKGLLVITHDLEAAARLGGQTAVMYAGRIVEQGTVEKVFNHPSHPYTRALLRALPANGLHPIPLRVHDRPVNGGCAFAPRCTSARDLCFHREPASPSFTGGCRCHAYPR
jgi:oligopeptide/dipeptide ABC transporter ATP-binding protein